MKGVGLLLFLLCFGGMGILQAREKRVRYRLLEHLCLLFCEIREKTIRYRMPLAEIFEESRPVFEMNGEEIVIDDVDGFWRFCVLCQKLLPSEVYTELEQMRMCLKNGQDPSGRLEKMLAVLETAREKAAEGLSDAMRADIVMGFAIGAFGAVLML